MKSFNEILEMADVYANRTEFEVECGLGDMENFDDYPKLRPKYTELMKRYALSHKLFYLLLKGIA